MYAGQTVIVVDDDPAMLELVTLQLTTAGLRVVSFRSAREALAHYSDKSAHCIISDVRMPDMDGLALQKELSRRKSRAPFIIITAHGDIPLAVAALQAGAVDIIEKPFTSVRLVSAIDRALTLRVQSDRANSARDAARSKLALLTPREEEILLCLVDGEPSKAIASALDISLRTVEVHRANIMRKLKVRTMAELVRLALSAQGAELPKELGGGSAPASEGG
jgi:FixJ family two-component response regulator